ncbi:MAG TPA: hypothetical protein VGL83_19800 [Stellaceae bacterium]|jgi:hypothetical protein
MAERTFIMAREPDLEELLHDDIMEPVMRSAHVTREDLRRQLQAIARPPHAREDRDAED